MKILVVDDSALVRSVLKNVLSSDPTVEMVLEASNGADGVELNERMNPDVVIMDIDMPVMNGLEATKAIMTSRPVPILVMSGHLDSMRAYTAIENGAVEAIPKPDLDQFNNSEFYSKFMGRINGALKARITPRNISVGILEKENNKKDFRMLVMGASTGGPGAVRRILQNIKSEISVPIVLVQHMETGFDTGYVNWLDQECEHLTVEMARHNMVPVPGHVIVAPADRHLKFEGNVLALDDGPEVLNQKPSVDILFNSAAKLYGSKVLGVLLTGMGSDGADGCVELRKYGGYTLVQNEESCVIFGMPRAAIEKNGADLVLSLEDIAKQINKFCVV